MSLSLTALRRCGTASRLAALGHAAPYSALAASRPHGAAEQHGTSRHSVPLCHTPVPSRTFMFTLVDWYMEARAEKRLQQKNRKRFLRYAVKDAVRAGAADSAEYFRKRGKISEAPNEATPVKSAEPLPTMRGFDGHNRAIRLTGTIKQVTVMFFAFREIALEPIPQYQRILEEYGHEDVRVIHIRGVDQPLFAILMPLLKFMMRWRAEVGQEHNCVHLTRKSCLHVRWMLNITNSMPLHVFLIDHKARVRWHVSGMPLTREKIAMDKILTELKEDARIARGDPAPVRQGKASLSKKL